MHGWGYRLGFDLITATVLAMVIRCALAPGLGPQLDSGQYACPRKKFGLLPRGQMGGQNIQFTLGILHYKRNQLWNRRALVNPEISFASLTAPEWTKGIGLGLICRDPQSPDGLNLSSSQCLLERLTRWRAAWQMEEKVNFYMGLLGSSSRPATKTSCDPGTLLHLSGSGFPLLKWGWLMTFKAAFVPNMLLS